MLIPIILLSVTGLITKKFNGDSVKQNFSRFPYAIIPLDLAGHIAHNLFHLLAEGKSVFFTFVELFGANMDISTAILDNETIQILQYILIVIGALGSIYTVYKIAKHPYGNKNSIKTTVVYTILLVFLAVVNLILFALPMEMRM